MASSPDPYLILGVSPTASDEELRTAYRRLVQLHHPDHNHGSRESALRFAEVQEAYVHVKLLRKQADTAAPPPDPAAGDSPLESRLAALENELRAAREQRRKAAHEAAQEAARAAARAQPQRPARGGDDDRATDEELGYYTTDDSFTKILDDFADQVATRFTESHGPQDGRSTPRRPRSVADWIDELGSRLTGESGPKKKD